jgi:hypothetical protein
LVIKNLDPISDVDSALRLCSDPHLMNLDPQGYFPKKEGKPAIWSNPERNKYANKEIQLSDAEENVTSNTHPSPLH